MDPEDEAQRIGETRILLPAVLCNIVFCFPSRSHIALTGRRRNTALLGTKPYWNHGYRTPWTQDKGGMDQEDEAQRIGERTARERVSHLYKVRNPTGRRGGRKALRRFRTLHTPVRGTPALDQGATVRESVPD